MGIWQNRSKRKPTGGLLKDNRKKRKFELGGVPIKTAIGQKKIKNVKVRGGEYKSKLISSETVNLTDNKNNTCKKVKVLDVLENPANPHFIRQKIITKGAIIKTDSGIARVTSRPGQDGQINAVLIEDEVKEPSSKKKSEVKSDNTQKPKGSVKEKSDLKTDSATKEKKEVKKTKN